MPTYTFRNKKTNREFIKEMKMSERENYLSENPNIEQILVPVGHYESTGQPPSDFQKYVIGRIKESAPKNSMGYSRYSIPKEI